MREKINLQELTSLLSDKAGISKKEADAFLREFFGLMTDSLIEDKIVKIRSLGTFKLTEVEARESVNVRTGERVLIPAHPKVSFSAEKALSEIINKPYEHLESKPSERDAVIINNEEKVKESEEQTEKVKEEQGKVFEEQTKTVEEPHNFQGQEHFSSTITHETQKVGEKKVEKETTKIFRKEADITEDKSGNDLNIEEHNIKEDIDDDDIAEDTIRRKKKQIKTVVFTFLIVALLIAIFYFLSRETGDTISPSAYLTPKTTTSSAPKGNKIEVADNNSIEDTIIINPQDTIAPIKDTFLPGKKRKTKVGERLTMISFEEYGDVVFWIYIYEENKHIISKDNYVKAGVDIIIPPADKYDIDVKNPMSLQKAREFAKNYNNNYQK